MDHRLIDHMNPPSQHQNQGSGSGISQHGTFGSNPVTLTSDSQPGHQQGIDWSSYQPPTKLFASPPPSTGHQSQRHQGPPQQPESSHTATSIPNWTAPVSDSPSPQAGHPRGGNGSSGDGQGLYTPESAGSILASFGLSNEDLEVLSHYPDDQLTPDTLPFILRDIQINKSNSQKTVASTSSSSFSRSVHDDWVDHINTVNHTAACRDLRNNRDVRYGSQALWDPKDHSPSHSMSRSLSGSPSPGPPHSKHGLGPHPHGPHGKLYSPHPRYPPRYPEHGHRLEYRHSGSRSPSHSHRTSMSSREHRPERGETSGGPTRSSMKRPHDDSLKCSTDTRGHPPCSKMGHNKQGLSQSSTKTTLKPPPAKKKKKIAMSASQDLSVAERLVYLTGIPNDASEQEVTDLVGSFGKINNVILMPCSEEESKKGEGQKASVCMVKAEDAQALANSTNLFIREQQITTSIAKKGMVLITGLPESNWSESDIIKLIQPFGTPSDIILASQIGKALVSVPDMEIAEEIVKVHTFIPAKINDSDLKITQVKQRVGLNTPENPVIWSTLLVISNVPNTPSGSSEVQKLVRRFGTVIKTLVLNNMVVCEMATAAMALSVYKRFQTFPCIIHNNPLFFSRKADPKASTQAKVINVFLDSTEETPANGKSGQTTAAAVEKETAHKEKSESGVEGNNTVGTEEMMESTEKMVGEDKPGEKTGAKMSSQQLQ
ncbi:hypothetical protein INR49_002053 [Caranx melampygus]|nr:hypothetical protein INR49_002053 [Caranx melampygus]